MLRRLLVAGTLALTLAACGADEPDDAEQQEDCFAHEPTGTYAYDPYLGDLPEPSWCEDSACIKRETALCLALQNGLGSDPIKFPLRATVERAVRCVHGDCSREPTLLWFVWEAEGDDSSVIGCRLDAITGEVLGCGMRSRVVF